MANIQTFLNNIRYARYGKEVRQSIHDAIKAIDGVADTAQDSATKSAAAASASEANAKAYMESALESEASAKASAEQAMSGTPEGYADLVEKVGLLDIAKSTDFTLCKSFAGGYRLLELQGNTEQNGTPSPDNPQPLKNTGDVVEMMQGYYSIANGVYTNSSTTVCNKNYIPCNGGDTVKLACEKPFGIAILWYSDSNYISGKTITDSKELEAVIPSGATKFSFFINAGVGTDITPQTVGKIQLTVNGKYLGCVRGHGKNFLDCRGLVTTTVNGITFTPYYNSKGELEYINANGTASANSLISIIVPLGKGDYIYNGCPSGGTGETYNLLLQFGGKSYFDVGYGTKFSITEDNTLCSVYLGRIVSGATVSNVKFKPMIRKADVTDDTYEPYKETIAWYYANEPTRLGDYMFKDSDGLFKLEHTFTNAVRDGSDDETFVHVNTKNGFGLFSIELPNGVVMTEVEQLMSDTLQTKSVAYWNKPTEECCCVGLSTVNGRIGMVLAITSQDEFKTWLAEKKPIFQYKLATPTIEVLDTQSQINLNSIETFDGVTYLEVDSRIPPLGIEGEYGTSQVVSELIRVESDCAKNTPMKKKYIMIGDSYGVGYTPDGNVTSWCSILKNRLGVADDKYIVQCQNGAGFAVTGNQFLSLLNKVTSDSTVTDIIVAGGFNDIDKGYDAINTAIATFKTQAKAKFPNAELKIAFIGGTKNSSMRYGATQVLDHYTKSCTVNSITMLNGCEYALRRYNEVFSSDGFHPNELGERYIAEYLFRALKGYSNTSYIQYVPSTLSAATLVTGTSGMEGMGAMVNNGVLHCSSQLPMVANYDNLNVGEANGNNAIQLCNITGGLVYGNQYHNILIPVTAIIRNADTNYEVPGSVVVANSGIAFKPFSIENNAGFRTLDAVQAVFLPPFSFCADALMC